VEKEMQVFVWGGAYVVGLCLGDPESATFYAHAQAVVVVVVDAELAGVVHAHAHAHAHDSEGPPNSTL
jgi:hypothetical protein